MRRELFLFIAFAFSATSFNTKNYSVSNSIRNSQQKNSIKMGISIVLYRVNKAENVKELHNIEAQFDKLKSVNLYKITQDIGIILLNTTEPFADTSLIPYKMMFGSYVEIKSGYRTINGFVPTNEVATICKWIKKHEIDNFEGFKKLYDNLSNDAKTLLEDIGADDCSILYKYYVKPLTSFYFEALANKNSIVICGE